MLSAVGIRQFEVLDHRANRRRRRQIVTIPAVAGDGGESDNQKRSEEKRKRVMLLHSIDSFQEWVTLKAKITSVMLDVASAVSVVAVSNSLLSFGPFARKSNRSRSKNATLTRLIQQTLKASGAKLNFWTSTISVDGEQ